jgi:hypothetical protein
MLAQMAATAGSVAVGSTIGHGISSMLFGGRSESAPVEQQQQAAPQQNTSSFAPNCEMKAKEFSNCLEKADLPSCTWYLEQLKAVSFQSVIHVLVLSVIFVFAVPGSCLPILIRLVPRLCIFAETGMRQLILVGGDSQSPCRHNFPAQFCLYALTQ